MRRPSALSAGRPASSVYHGDPSTSIVLDRWDALCLGALLLLWFSLLVLHYSSLPLQTWDEARNANNALEIARSGHWLVPSYEGIPDHWNTKPPLMIWQMSALMRLGLPPLLAVRLPTMLAALATVGAVWGSVVRACATVPPRRLPVFCCSHRCTILTSMSRALVTTMSH